MVASLADAPDGQQLADVLSEFARTLLTEFSIQAILDHLVHRIVDILPVDSAGVTLIAPGSDPRYITAADEFALACERLQTELDEGPCLLAYHSGKAVTVPDLAREDRFPIFGPRALSAGLVGVFTFPLRHGEHRLGALDLYRHRPGMLSDRTMAAAQTLADVVTAYLLNAQARADLQAASDRSTQAALHDPLTGLPNRVLMFQRLEHALARTRRSDLLTAVLLLDLDRFKGVNDSLGHQVGDELLVAVTARLGHLLRPGDTLSRMSGDEFVIICEEVDNAAQATAIAARILTGLHAPFHLSAAAAAVAVTASIGVAVADHGDGAAKQLLHEADTAMYQAKREGGARQILQQAQAPTTGLEQELRGAATRGELLVEYQPILATANQQITGFEALLRWVHPRRGLIAPELFIPLAEAAGMIGELGQWVLRQAWADRRRWHQSFPAARLGMSVNVSAHQLMSPGFVAIVADTLAGADDPAAVLTLEITESVLIGDRERALLVLSDLKDLGVQLALDDFGTGYSSLIYLQQFPVDIIKIDRSFIAALTDEETSHTIVQTVVDLAHALRMTVVAEGIETPAQQQQVTAIGADYYQGFHFGRPVPAEQVAALLQSTNPHPSPRPDRTGALPGQRDISAGDRVGTIRPVN